MLLALDGNKTAYQTLLEELSRLLKAYFTRNIFRNPAVEADDLVQETLIAIHTRRITYDRTMALLPWVNGIARHKLIDYLRRLPRHAAIPLDEDFAIADEADAVMARLDVERMLGSIPERTAGLIRKVKIEGQSVNDVAQADNLSQSAVKVAIHRGLAMLGKRFGGQDHD